MDTFNIFLFCVRTSEIITSEYYHVLHDTIDFPSLTPGVHKIGAELSKTSSTLPFFAPVNCTLAFAFASLRPIPAPIVIESGVTVKPLPRPKLLEPA